MTDYASISIWQHGQGQHGQAVSQLVHPDLGIIAWASRCGDGQWYWWAWLGEDHDVMEGIDPSRATAIESIKACFEITRRDRPQNTNFIPPV